MTLKASSLSNPEGASVASTPGERWREPDSSIDPMGRPTPKRYIRASVRAPRQGAIPCDRPQFEGAP